MCFDLTTANDRIDEHFRYVGNDIEEMRCKNGTKNGVCTECRKSAWVALTDHVTTKSFKPDEIIKNLFTRFETHADLCKNLPKYDKKSDVPNIVEHNKVVLKGINQLLYQNYVLTMVEDKKRVTDLLRNLKNELRKDIELLKSIQNTMDNKFTQLNTYEQNLSG